MSATAKILGARPALTVRHLLREWGPEIGVDPNVLRDLLVEAIANGELDGDGLLLVDPTTGEHRDTNSEDLYAELARQPGFSPSVLLRMLADTDRLAVKRTPLVAFCAKRGINPPSFWASLRSTKATNTTKHRGGRPAEKLNQIAAWLREQPEDQLKLSASKLADVFIASLPTGTPKDFWKVDSVRRMIGTIRKGS